MQTIRLASPIRLGPAIELGIVLSEPSASFRKR
jgi:hypothetical protein